jgi:anti-sigma factor RsiW
MSPCERVDSLLSAFIEQEASPSEIRFVEGHLTVCNRCREQVEDMRRLLGRLEDLPRVSASPGFTDRVLEQVRGLPAAGLEEPVVPMPSAATPRWVVPLAAAAALALAIFGLNAVPGLIPTQTVNPVADAIDEPAQSANPAVTAAPSTPASVPEVATLDPDFATDERVQSLGMANETYVIQDFELRQPTGGGEPVLTRVGASTDRKVLVTF